MYEAESAARLNAPADGEAARCGRGVPRKIRAPCPDTKKAADASAAFQIFPAFSKPCAPRGLYLFFRSFAADGYRP